LESIKKIIDDRHNIIHKGVSSGMTEAEIDEILDSIKYLRNTLYKKSNIVHMNSDLIQTI
jgi:hypothetical protein